LSEELARAINEFERAVRELEIVMNALAGWRRSRDLRKAVIALYKDVLVERGVVPEKIERFVYEDRDGRYYVKGSKIEFNVYVNGGRVYLIEAEPIADVEDVEWLYKRGEIYEKITGRKPDKLILVAIDVSADARKRARELGVEVITGR
jgi:hypothetical protein